MELGSADPLMLYYLGYKKTAYYYSFLSSFLLYSPRELTRLQRIKSIYSLKVHLLKFQQFKKLQPKLAVMPQSILEHGLYLAGCRIASEWL